MKTTGVAESIAALLRENEVVMIPGLGAFRGTYASARVDQVLGEVHPPCLQVEFDEQLAANDGLLVEFLCYTAMMSPESAGSEIRRFVATVKEALSRQETVAIPEVGKLRLNIEGRIQFFPDDKNLLPETFGLRHVRFHPIKTATPRVGELQTGYADGKRRPARSSLAILAMVIVVAFVAYVALNPGIKAFFERTQARNGSEEQGSIPVSDAATLAFQDRASSVVAQDKRENSAPSGKCIIAIGIFKDPENVRQMEKRIRNAGFEPYTEKLRGLTRVGVQFSYQQESEIKKVLASVRGTLSPEAFVWKQVGPGGSGE